MTDGRRRKGFFWEVGGFLVTILRSYTHILKSNFTEVPILFQCGDVFPTENGILNRGRGFIFALLLSFLTRSELMVGGAKSFLTVIKIILELIDHQTN